MQSLTDAYAVQIEAEKKLQTVMRQRMDATAAEIQSIKELAAAQQQIGVIGDEVQLSGAQQIATFLTQKASLDVLIPAMNNLLAQQKGLNATTQDAVSIGNLMGKAMQGQTSALTRVGIIFNEAQEKVMKFGTETERAAMLAEIIFYKKSQTNRRALFIIGYCRLAYNHLHTGSDINAGRKGNSLNCSRCYRNRGYGTACKVIYSDCGIGSGTYADASGTGGYYDIAYLFSCDSLHTGEFALWQSDFSSEYSPCRGNSVNASEYY